jgi:hypothetical protein
VPGQLEGEYWRGTWRIYNSSVGAGDIFRDPVGLRGLWPKMMAEMVAKGVDEGGEAVVRRKKSEQAQNPLQAIVTWFELVTGVQGQELPDQEGAMVSAPIVAPKSSRQSSSIVVNRVAPKSSQQSSRMAAVSTNNPRKLTSRH